MSGASHEGTHMPKKRQNQAISKDNVYQDPEIYGKVTNNREFNSQRH